MSLKCAKVTSILLTILLAHIAYPSPALAGDRAEQEVQFAQKAKNEITKLGTGPDARVEVKLRDKTKLKGHFSEVSDQSFAVVDDKTGVATTVTYPQVKQVRGNNLSPPAQRSQSVSASCYSYALS
jgi:hypothetical protein